MQSIVEIKDSSLFLKSNFQEKENEKTGKKEYYIEAFIVPYNEISRNGVRYLKESIEKTHTDLVGKPVMFNHVTSGVDAISRGEWVDTWLTEEGMWGRARIYNTKYNEDVLEYLREASSPAVSLQITGVATNKKETIDGKERYVREAEISEWLECSIIGGVQGFKSATIKNFEVAICEAFNNEETAEEIVVDEETTDDFFEKLDEIRASYIKESLSSESLKEDLDLKKPSYALHDLNSKEWGLLSMEKMVPVRLKDGSILELQAKRRF